MKIYETENYEEMSRKAANILSAQVILKPDCVLGLATGSTPIGTYGKTISTHFGTGNIYGGFFGNHR